VSFDDQAYSADIEVREKAGTPGILQTLRASLAMELKEKLGADLIAARERDIVGRVHAVLSTHPAIDLMGNVGPEHRLPIFSFNVRVGRSWLHPRFVTRLLNDLFGIQSRAGCSCAAPYGHRILHIDAKKSRDLRRSIMGGNIGLKPGWARVNFHFLHTDEEVDFICRAILFVAEQGKHFLPLYRFDIHSGSWQHGAFAPPHHAFGLAEALAPRSGTAPASAGPPAARAEEPDHRALFARYLAEAESLARGLRDRWLDTNLKHTEEDLIPFVYM
jgi:hypothetical protein